MGLARLTKVTIISTRTDYPEVAKTLAQFKDFHPLAGAEQNFDPAVQELTVRAVRLFSQSDQAAKDLGLQLSPGWMDMVFKGVKVERQGFEAEKWDDLLGRAEAELEPIAKEVRTLKAGLQKAAKEEADAQTLRDALKVVSGFSADLAGMSEMKRFKALVCIVKNEGVSEFRNSLPDPIFLSQQLNQTESVVLAVVKAADGPKLEKAVKALEIRTLSIPPTFSQNPTEAYKQLTRDFETAAAKRTEIEASISKAGEMYGSRLLAVRELTESARDMLDEARVSGAMNRMATISGYIPAKKEVEFKRLFGKWMTYSEPAADAEEHAEVPVLLENPRGVRLWQLITAEQGIPGKEEVDPTPLISFVFPIFFGLMFGDFGHGLIFTLFILFVRQRVIGTKRQWANIFLLFGISSMVFGAIFGEFFGFSLYSALPIPPIAQYLNLDIVNRTGAVPVPDIPNFERLMIISIVIGMIHLTTGLALDIYEGVKGGETLHVVIDKIPALTMYVSGVGYGIAFVVAGFKFNVLASTVPSPLFGIPNNVLGGVSMAVLLPSMLVLFLGKGVAVKLGKVPGTSFAGALSDGGLEVFEKILQFLSNTISYVRLAVMLLVHAVLLLIVSEFFPLTSPVLIPAWVVFNLMVLALEGLIVYVQDLRLHVYEFFTKFYIGTGRPFRRILPDRPRVNIKWL